MSDSAQKRILLVGAGNMGKNHARVVSGSPDARLAVIVDPREAVGRAEAERFGATWAPELPDLANIDGVIVAAATEAHYGLAMQVIASGTPLLIEKPVADSLLRTREILDAADAADLPMMCGLLERFNPAVLTAMALIEAPHHITATRHSPYAPRIKTGVSWDLLVHDVDLAISIMGRAPSDVQARLGFFHPDSESSAEDVAEALLDFDGRGLAQISASRIGHRKIRELKVYDHDKLVEIDLLRKDVTLYRHVSENSVDEGRGYRQQTVIEIPQLVTSQEPLTSQFDLFLKLIDGTADAAAQRATILPSHEVIDRVISTRVATVL